MSENVFYIIQIASTFSALPALVFGILSFKKVPLSIQLFVAFFALGFLIDLSGWYFFLTKNGSANQNLRYGYILVECVFYFWFVGTQIPSKIARLLCKNAWILLFPLWALAIRSPQGIRYFMVVFQVVISSILSYCVLRNIEREENVWQLLVFWILLGSFFYYFCTFFFMSFLDSQFGINLWYLRNIIGIIGNIIFAWGVIVHRRSILPFKP